MNLQLISDRLMQKRKSETFSHRSSLLPTAHCLLPKKRGFSLIELIVVVGIMIALSSVILVNNASFGGTVLLRNLAYDIALSIREAQVYGISVRKFGTGAGEFTAGYGMHFRVSSNNSYILFADLPTENGRYDGLSEQADTFSISRGFYISDLCVVPAGGSEWNCHDAGVDRLNIVFKRPEPDARIRYNDNSALNQRAKIVISSPRGETADIILEATGQISVQ